MPFIVPVLDEVEYGLLTEKRAAELCATAFEARGIDPDDSGEVSVALVDEDSIKRLNKEFRDIDAPTDVLSFEIDGPGGEIVGEIVIAPGCVDTEMTVEEMLVHGALHLSGMEHGPDFESSEMSRLQTVVMEKVRG